MARGLALIFQGLVCFYGFEVDKDGAFLELYPATIVTVCCSQAISKGWPTPRGDSDPSGALAFSLEESTFETLRIDFL